MTGSSDADDDRLAELLAEYEAAIAAGQGEDFLDRGDLNLDRAGGQRHAAVFNCGEPLAGEETAGAFRAAGRPICQRL
jgi:hypothetical protein